MDNIILKELIITNFKGISSLNLTFHNKTTNIYGKNGSGKTSIADALLWLLTDKSFETNTEFNPKPLDDKSKEIPNLETSVTAIFDINNELRKFQKVLTEKYKTNKSTGETSFTGNTKTYYVDEILCQRESDFKEFVDKVVDLNLLKHLINPWSFASDLGWSERREILINMTDNLDTKALLQAHPKFNEISNLLLNHNINTVKKSLADNSKEKIKERDALPNTILELEKLKVLHDFELIEQQIITCKEKIKFSQEKLNNLSAQEINKNLLLKQESLQQEYKVLLNQQTDAIAKINEESMKNNETIQQQYTENTNAIHACKSNIVNWTNTLKNMSELNDNYLTQHKTLKEQRENENIKTFDQNDTICPTCNQQLTDEKIKRLLTNFNIDKANMLMNLDQKIAEIQQNGNLNMTKANELNTTINAEKIKLTKLIEKAESDKLQMSPKEETLAPPYETELNLIKKEFESLNQAINLSEEKVLLDNQKEILNKEITLENNNLEELNNKLSNKHQNEKIDERILFSKNKLKSLSQEIMENERKLNLVNQFNTLKINLLEEGINNLFTLVNVKLFETLTNGNIVETCKILIKNPTTNALVPLNAANDAAKVAGGIDIINALNSFYNTTFPIFIDKRGEVSDIPETKSQVINLYVDPSKEKIEIK